MNDTKINGIKIPTEIYSRVSGYFRPVKQWNAGKQAEFSDRKKCNLEMIKGRLSDEKN